MAPALFKKKSNEMEVAGAVSRSMTSLHSPLDEKFLKLPDSPQGSLAHELTTNSTSSCAIKSSSVDRTVGHLFSSASASLCCSPLSPNTSRSTSSPLSSKPLREIISFPAKPFDSYAMESNDVSWNMETVDNFLDIQVNMNSDQDGHLETCTAGKNDFEWADQLISVDEPLDSNWSDVLIDPTVPDPNAPVSPATPSTKARMRWTPELHEVFVDAVNKLGGGESATPKAVLKLMNVEGLTIYHVKSHLQKYRTTRLRPESSEGASERKSNAADRKTPLDLKTTMGITEALRMQMEVQKQLHEQLEIQKNLQLRIEEQGKCLQMMFEQQRKMEQDKLKPSSSHSEDEPTQVSSIESSERKPTDGSEPVGSEVSPPSKRAKLGKKT